jgi:DNA polymerase-3 subunit delta'
MDARIISCHDIHYAKEQILSQIDSKLTKVYECDEFKVDDSKAVMREAYIAEENLKHLVIVATTYRIEAQNALLKLLEEPPRNIVFILIAKSKTALLPTIRSRMPIESIAYEKELFELSIDVHKMELADIFTFLKTQKSISKVVLKETIEALLVSALHGRKMQLYERELALFDNSLHLAELNARPQNILSVLLLMLYHARGRKIS